MSWAIAAACSSTVSVDQNACNKLLEAGTKQVQVYQTEEKTEDYFKVMATDKAGKDVETVGVSAVFVYKSYKNKAVDFRLPNIGLCDKTTVRLGRDSYSLGFNWHFPW